MPLGSSHRAVGHCYLLHHGSGGLHHLVLATGHHRRQHQLPYAHQLDCPHPLQLLQRYVCWAWIHPSGLETSKDQLSAQNYAEARLQNYHLKVSHWVGVKDFKPDFVSKQEKQQDVQYLQYCRVCQGYKAPRSHHCRKCNR